MATEVENALKDAVKSVAKYVDDAATMTVETWFVEVAMDGGQADFAQAKPAAKTVVRLDGDSQTTVPLQKNEAGILDVDTDLYQIHQQNVQTAIDYRAKILSALLDVLKQK